MLPKAEIKYIDGKVRATCPWCGRGQSVPREGVSRLCDECGNGFRYSKWDLL